MIEQQNISWKSFLINWRNVLLAGICFASTIGLLMLKKSFLEFNEARKGTYLYDFFLQSIGPYDINTIIFIVTYGSICFGLVLCFLRPWITIHLLLAITFLVTMRICTLFFFPLEAPTDIIPLEDLFLKFTFYDKAPLVKDLFFSGHTASLFTLYLLNRRFKWLSSLLLFNSIVLGMMLMVQHVHYTVDIVAAFPFAFLAYFLASKVSIWLYKLNDSMDPKFESVTFRN